MYKNLNYIFCLLLLLLFGTACRDYDNPEDEDRDFPSPANLEIQYSGVNEILVTWEDRSSIEEGFRITLSGSTDQTLEVPADTTSCTFTDVIPGEYTVEIVAFVKKRTTYPIRINFNFKETKPIFGKLTFLTRETNFIEVSSFIETVDSLTLLEHGVCWSIHENPTAQDSCRKVTNADPIKISGLIPDTRYYFRSYIKSYSGVYYGKPGTMATYKESKERIVAGFNPKQLFDYVSKLSISGDNLIIDWGDGNWEAIGSPVQSVDLMHAYDSDAKWEVVFYGDRIRSLSTIREYVSVNDDNYFYNTCDMDYIDPTRSPSLLFLSMNFCSLTSLNITENKLLTNLDVESNRIASLDVSKNKNLRNLQCSGNNLESIDISNNTLLWVLDCRANHIPSLDISHCPDLTYLTCSNNLLQTIDLSKCPKLQYVDVSGNLLETLDLSHNLDLSRLTCLNNRISQLNLSRQLKLNYLYCSYNIISQLLLPKSLLKMEYVGLNNNLLPACTLNAVFEAIPSVTRQEEYQYTIELNNNPGSATCRTSVATSKGWRVSMEGDGSADCGN